MTRVYISVDMEGIAGVATREQVHPGTPLYGAAQRLMTGEANAAVVGAYAGGATSVVVVDAHGSMDNLLIDDLDERCEVLMGAPKRVADMLGSVNEADVAVFIGYHAAAGSAAGCLAHSYSGHLVELRVNGRPCGEAELNAAVCAEFGVPVGLVTGDDALRDELRERAPFLRTEVVKWGAGRTAARSLTPGAARRLLHDRMRDLVHGGTARLTLGSVGPSRVEIELAHPGAADVCAKMPRTERTGPRSVAYDARRPTEAIQAVETWCSVLSS